MEEINVIGAGLAGCECAWILANNNIKVNLYEMKPKFRSAAHNSDDLDRKSTRLNSSHP